MNCSYLWSHRRSFCGRRNHQRQLIGSGCPLESWYHRIIWRRSLVGQELQRIPQFGCRKIDHQGLRWNHNSQWWYVEIGIDSWFNWKLLFFFVSDETVFCSSTKPTKLSIHAVTVNSTFADIKGTDGVFHGVNGVIGPTNSSCTPTSTTQPPKTDAKVATDDSDASPQMKPLLALATILVSCVLFLWAQNLSLFVVVDII